MGSKCVLLQVGGVEVASRLLPHEDTVGVGRGGGVADTPLQVVEEEELLDPTESAVN